MHFLQKQSDYFSNDPRTRIIFLLVIVALKRPRAGVRASRSSDQFVSSIALAMCTLIIDPCARQLQSKPILVSRRPSVPRILDAPSPNPAGHVKFLSTLVFSVYYEAAASTHFEAKCARDATALNERIQLRRRQQWIR